jgi:hypothetical protein
MSDRFALLLCATPPIQEGSLVDYKLLVMHLAYKNLELVCTDYILSSNIFFSNAFKITNINSITITFFLAVNLKSKNINLKPTPKILYFRQELHFLIEQNAVFLHCLLPLISFRCFLFRAFCEGQDLQRRQPAFR